MIQAYLSPTYLNKREIEPIVIKEADQFVSFMFGFAQFLDNMNFLDGTTIFVSVPKNFRFSFFLYECINHLDKLINAEIPLYEIFYNMFRNGQLLKKTTETIVN